MSSFSVIGASGTLLRKTTWTATDNSAIKIGINERQRTFLDHESERTTYLIANGQDKDFVRLTPGNGFEVTPQSRLSFRSRIWHSSSISSRIIVLEFDTDGKRISESVITVNNDALVYFHPDTKHALLTLRIQGNGRLAFTELQAELETTPSTEESPIGVQHFKLHTLPLRSNLSAGDLKRQVSEIELAVRTLGQQLVNAEKVPTLTSVSDITAVPDARNDGSISSSRERFLRQLLINMAKDLPDTNGSHHFQPLDLRVGVIADESMFNFYKDSCREVHYLSPTNYQEIFRRSDLDAIIYVTCWKGLEDNEWKGVKFREAPLIALENILAYAKEQEIPTIFQSIEDPSNFDNFLDIAAQFDHVFTSDTDCIERYRNELGHANVHYGEYGANPWVNNPIGAFRHDIPRALFSGSYPDRYPERTKDMRIIFDSIANSDESLTIIDRNFNTEDFRYPQEYQSSVIGPLPHDLLQKVHKLFRYSLNFNSIKDSPTMCAMRVYELQAQGKPLISNYARSVFNNHPEIRIIPHLTDFTELQREVPRLTDLARAQRALSRIMTKKTSYHVVGRMFETVGVPHSSASRSEKILVVALGNFENVVNRVSRQKHIEADVVSEHDFLDEKVDIRRYGYIAAMSSETEYGDYYLAGRKAGFIYTDSSFTTQLAHFDMSGLIPGPIHEFTDRAERREWTMVSSDDTDGREFIKGNIPQLIGDGYAADPFEVNFTKYLRHRFQEKGKSASRLTIVIPVYDNGDYLVTKCLPSIKRHEDWETFQILLVDDGSTDSETLEICQDLVSLYPNVNLLENSDGGSGSASRPRNQGIKATHTEFITFLDPDNEISENGYNILLRHYDHLKSKGNDVDFVSGYQVKVARDSRLNGLHTPDSVYVVHDSKQEFFNQGKFPVVSSQASIIRTEFLRAHNIDFVEKAAGQDTLFGWEILAQANQAAFTSDAYIIYYAERDGSVTNDINANYYSKSLILEREQAQRLEKMGLLNLYKNHHLEQFFRNWYIPRLAMVDAAELTEAKTSLSRIADIYGLTLADFE